MTDNDVWQAHAAQWNRVGSPLRPSVEDTRLLAAALGDRLDRASHAFILGATPEMSLLPWAPNAVVAGIDHSLEMIRVRLPASSFRTNPVCGDWRAFPLRLGSFDIAVSDGCFGVTRHPDEHRTVLRNVKALLRPSGRFAFRAFVVPPARRETPREIFEAALDGRIGSFHALKIRLWMALQPDAATGVRVRDVWRVWSTEGPSREALAERTGWPLSTIDTIDAYRDKDDIYTLPTVDQLRSVARECGFRELSCAWPAYELGECCPTLAFEAEPE